MSGSLPIGTETKTDLERSERVLQEREPALTPQQSAMNSNTTQLSTSPHRGLMLGSLKAYYRKLRTFKGTVHALINLRRTPLLSSIANEKAVQPISSVSEDRRRSEVVFEVKRISATAASTVQSQVQKLVAEGHIVTEIDPTSDLEITYRQQGNLDHYTKANLAKRLSLQQHPNMIALTQRLWNCALRNGETKLKYTDYESYMLCLHRLILPEFDAAASKELIMNDWKRDSGEQNYLDYAFFHLSMFELVDLWTDTVDPEDYISLLYCITHCLTYLLNDRHLLKPLNDISNVDILEASKATTVESIKQDLQRELNSESFTYYQDQVKLTTEAKQATGRRSSGPSRRESRIQHTNRSRDRKRSSSINMDIENLHGDTTREMDSQHRRTRSGSSVFNHDTPKRKSSVQVNRNALTIKANVPGSDLIDGASTVPTPPNYLTDETQVSPRRGSALTRGTSPNVLARPGVTLNIGMMDGLVISNSAADDKSVVAVSMTTAFPRRSSRSVSHSIQQTRDPLLVAGNVNSTGLQMSHTEAAGLTLRAGLQDPNSPGYILRPTAPSGKSHEPFTVRAAADAEAASLSITAAPGSPRQTQRPPFQIHQDEIVVAVPGGATRKIPPNFCINNSSLTTPLTPRDATLSANKIQLQLQEISDPHALRVHTPHERLLLPSPRVSTAITAQSTDMCPSSPRLTNCSTSRRPTFIATPKPGSISNSEYQTPRKLLLHDEILSSGAANYSSAATTSILTVSGRTATTNNGIELPNADRQALKLISNTRISSFPGNSLGLPFVSSGTSDALSSIVPLKDDLQALLSPRYVVTNPAANHSTQFSSTMKQSSIRPQSSTRRVQNSLRFRHQPSKLANGPVSRQQRHPSELHGLAIAPGKSG